MKYSAASKPRWTRWNGYHRLVGAFLLLLAHQVSLAGTENATSVEGGNNAENSALSHELLVTRGYDPSSINLETVPSDPKTVGDEVVLADGDVIRGTITSEDENEVVLLHPVFNEMRIPRDRIVAIRRQAPPRRGAGFGEVVTGAGVRPPNSQTQGMTTTGTPAETGKPKSDDGQEETVDSDSVDALINDDYWTFVLGTAFGYVQNVNTELNVRLSAQAEHTSEFARLRLSGAYFLNSSNDTIVDNDFLFNTTQDWFVPDSNWSIFATGTYQWDAFELWEHRISGYIGPGYKLVDRPELSLNMRVGAGATYEYGIPQTLPEALISMEWSWEVDDRQSLNGVMSYVPDFTMIEQYRLEFNGEWNFRLQKEEGLSFYMGVRNQFQSIVPEGSTKNDLRLFGGVKYEF